MTSGHSGNYTNLTDVTDGFGIVPVFNSFAIGVTVEKVRRDPPRHTIFDVLIRLDEGIWPVLKDTHKDERS